ncbi:phosphatidylinositol-3-phosphate phosphatase MTMR7-like isoform X1 [Pseudochaenichthys georgianus]|uniref:phosphatidylinositol-3-phosphate phosphatase MTMR7-like isoform X1 n=1 Tax=Pseudochaenichthys georgianus TaxID=52239 RepID=UPI00146EBEB2|nr:myotubularin-related protein 7b isoform X1 [Pseudochaenichthys georgianus]
MEHIRTPKVENVRLLDRSSGQRKASIGTLYLSATHTIFVENNPETRKESWVLHSMVSSVERTPTIPAGSQVILRCKDFRVFQILVPQERDCLDVHTSLVRLSRPEKYSELYCLSFNPNVNKEERQESWSFMDLTADYKRMGLPNNLWVSTAANSEYRVCETYPSELYVPKSATPPIIVGSARFRSRGRFPALSYFHQDTLAAVCRCSQPLSGFSGRCQEDEAMLQALMKANPGSDYIYVVDTRPKLNAMANRAAGKGYENEDHYTNIKLHFIGIENIHVMRSSQQKVIDVGEMRFPSMTDFLYGLENSGWLKHIKAILDAGLFIARAVADEGVSVLVHCSDGWDRTAQACSVASILLDPYYRTIRGLMVLIERDWVSFGHKFSHRYGHLDGDPKEVSPVIDQFVECVWQLSEQFPCAFEFNERFLVAIHTHIYSCQYGTFLGNCQKERRDMRLGERTHSVWPELWKERAQYTNPLYRAEQSQSQGVLRPNTTPYCFKMWKGLYNHAEKSTPPRQSPADFLSTVREESQQLEEELANQQERIAALTGEPITWEEVLRRRTSRPRPPHCGPDPPCLIQTQPAAPPHPAGSPSAADLGSGVAVFFTAA